MSYAPGRFQILSNPHAYEFGVGDRLRKTLAVNNLSVEEVATYLSVSRNTVGNWLSGRTTPDRRTLMAWASMLAVPLEWLEDGIWPTEWHEAYVDAGRAEHGLPPIFEAVNTETAPAEAGAVSNVRHEGLEPPTFWSVVSLDVEYELLCTVEAVAL